MTITGPSTATIRSARSARLAAFWALVLRRFRSHAQRSGEAAAGPGQDEEGR